MNMILALNKRQKFVKTEQQKLKLILAAPTTTSKITLNCFLDTSLSNYEKVKL